MANETVLPGKLAKPNARSVKSARGGWTVIDDLPIELEICDAEIDLFEAYFGDVIDELLQRPR